MSGIVGIIHFDGAPVHRALLGRMTAFLDFRGPDAREMWINRNVGFGHTLFRTTFQSADERQPFSFDGETHIVADCRVDARAELIAKLRTHGRNASLQQPDAELILHAYHVWGEGCMEHLLGDFAFAIWDAPRQKLFCARDHLGVKPFYYAHIGTTIIFSNTLDCIRLHPLVSDKLNDLAIADFLLFDMNQDPARTSFADVQRIPAAHRAWFADGRCKLSRYWSLPIDEPVYYKRPDDYTDRFKELLDQAVSDRLRTNQVGVFMSGGIDSPTLAATACKILRGRDANAQVHAQTTLLDGIDGNERYYVKLVADHLKIPLLIQDLSGTFGDPNWASTKVHTPEPFVDPTRLAIDRELNRELGNRTRVWFYGEGPDNALNYEWQAHLSYLTTKRRFGRLMADVVRHMVHHRRIPLLPSIPNLLKVRWQRRSSDAGFPAWLNPDLETRLQLRDREWQNQYPAQRHPVRPAGHASFGISNWDALFHSLDAEFAQAPYEVRHPFLALPLVRFLLSVPVMPWCRSKYLVRRAMRGALPEAVLKRAKTPLSSYPTWQGARRQGLPVLEAALGFREYVDPLLVTNEMNENQAAFSRDSRPRALNYWLSNLRATAIAEPTEGLFYETAR